MLSQNDLSLPESSFGKVFWIQFIIPIQIADAVFDSCKPSFLSKIYCSSHFLLFGSHVLSHIPQIHEKEEEEMNEKNDNANCLNEEPLITADQVCVFVCAKQPFVCVLFLIMRKRKQRNTRHSSQDGASVLFVFYLPLFTQNAFLFTIIQFVGITLIFFRFFLFCWSADLRLQAWVYGVKRSIGWVKAQHCLQEKEWHIKINSKRHR